MASLSPSPVMVLTPFWGEAATTSWPPWRRMATACIMPYGYRLYHVIEMWSSRLCVTAIFDADVESAHNRVGDNAAWRRLQTTDNRFPRGRAVCRRWTLARCWLAVIMQRRPGPVPARCRLFR